MEKASIVKRQFRMEEWRKRITECQSSGMPVSHWCKQNGYCEQTYYKYLKKIRAKMVEDLSVSVTEQSKPAVFKKIGGTDSCPRYTSCCYMVPLWKSLKEPVSRPLRQYSLHCRVYVRRYHGCRKHIHCLRAYR